MRRVNAFEVRPRSHRDRVLLREVLDASAALWNDLTYHRRNAFFDDRDVWGIDADEYRVRYKGIFGSATAQQLIRKSNEAWRSFFALLEDGKDASPPGYWKHGDERELQTLIRNDMYSLEWGERSRLEIPVGHDLKELYGLGYHDRLRLEARGDPRWCGEHGRLELVYDRDAESFRARQSVSDAVRRRDDSLATTSSDDEAVAALDIGANSLVAVTPPPATNGSTTPAPHSNGFARPLGRSPPFKNGSNTAHGRVNGFASCIAGGRRASLTCRTPSSAILWSGWPASASVT